ncbi:MAG TPA: MucR family transcriptional regulator [Acidisoma sp.]|uniref:MucR family transcriptional regulator n=1 Tax=Acidisoma sp. TaxID=1872115 RepID=UPI002B8821CB|nr:MucR family transcriptional regulator [Acidisoma sp.]HTI00709.1 MucR family transcriptional regulator [Acidisoma sp.]
MSFTISDIGLRPLISDIVSAYVAHHTVEAREIPALIQSVCDIFVRLGAPSVELETSPLEPAVPIKKSIFPDYIICLEDGKKLKLLKRHLKATYKMTPNQYRAKWGLPASYPMVAPTYAARRSTLAKANGLGRKKSLGSAPGPVVQTISDRRRGRGRWKKTEQK